MFNNNNKNNNIPTHPKAVNPTINTGGEPLKRTVDILRNDINEFKTQILKKIETIEHSINILDEDYFELKEKLNTSTKNKLSKTQINPKKPTNEKNLELKLNKIEKTIKELFVFGKLSINNHEAISLLQKAIIKLDKMPKEIIIHDDDNEKELERFSKLEKDIDLLKDNQIQLTDE
ncbi:MAG: hypothetical protein KAS12_06690 [Candidatus Aenigmarchaeota archaeon]|nr:hypothetical protein [Candidatus Aenigmarchaeota archaeon]